MTKPSLGSTLELDRQSDRRSDPDYLRMLSEHPGTRYMMLAGGRPVLYPAGLQPTPRIAWFTRAAIADAGADPGRALFLGTVSREGRALFAMSISASRLRILRAADSNLAADIDLRTLATEGLLDEDDLALVGLAKSLAHWHENTRCCGRCGSATKLKDGGWKRRCWSCGREHFPRLDPVVIMLVVHPDGERCLLSHETRFRKNMYSALAGYIEPGEDIEHAVRREVFEETQVRVGDVRFQASQPWPFPHTLMLGCQASALSEDIIPDALEIADARWFSRSEAQAMLDGRHPDGLFVPGRQAIAHTLIRRFVDDGGGS